MKRTKWSRRKFLAAGCAIAITAILLPGLVSGRAADTPSLSAGAGKAQVAFPAGLFPLDGFAGEHDPLFGRVLLLDDGRQRVAIVVIDLTSVSDEMITGMKTILTDIAGVPAENTLICASHTFSTPHVFSPGRAPAGTDMARNDAMSRAFGAAVRTAATQAVAALQPAHLGYGSGTSRVNVNRDLPTPAGWWLGANESGFADPYLGVLRIDDVEGKPLAILMNFAVQSSIMDGSQRAAGGKLISADLAGSAARYVETHYGADTVALFLVGAAGDQAPYFQANRQIFNRDGNLGQSDLHETGFTLVDLLGERLGADIVQVCENILTKPSGHLRIQREKIEVTSQEFSPADKPVGPVTAFDYRLGAQVMIPVVLLRIGDMTLVGIQPELAAIIGAHIRANSPSSPTIVATMVDGAAKYLPDAQSYDRFTYEARNSPYAKGAAETAAAAIVGSLKRMNASYK